MKKTKFHEIVTCILFCSFIFGMGAMYLLLPKDSFSQLEKRYLATAPELTAESLISGEFGSDLETYMADHMPGRDFFVGLGAYYDLMMGQQSSKDIYRAEDGRLVETPVVWNPERVDINIRYINRFAQTVGQDVDLILVPSAGFILEDDILGIHDSYHDGAYIDAIYDLAGDNVRCLDLTDLYQNAGNKQDFYYRTDHHWTSLGAYMTYQTYMQCLGRPYKQQEYFTVQTHSGFRGSNYSRSGLWLTPAEELEIWVGTALQVESSLTGKHQGAFYYERLQEADMYTVFLNGNQPLVRIYNENNAGKGKILVIRDSYANCIGPFLAESYEEVVMVDLRYYKEAISKIAAEEGFDNILVLYSIGNFMTDKNFPYLK